MRYGPIANESEEYRKARAELLEAEMALRDQRERVAALRRGLPADTLVEDYELTEGPPDLNDNSAARPVKLSGLFEDKAEPLLIYQFMYGAAQKNPCPMCSMWIDGFNGIARHLRKQVNFAIVAEAGIQQLRDWARQRAWTGLRIVSSAGSSFKKDLQFEDSQGRQHPGVSVFVRSPDGAVKHFYSASAYMREKEYRGIDLLSPVWNLMDLTPEGRGNWMPSLVYD